MKRKVFPFFLVFLTLVYFTSCQPDPFQGYEWLDGIWELSDAEGGYQLEIQGKYVRKVAKGIPPDESDFQKLRLVQRKKEVVLHVNCFTYSYADSCFYYHGNRMENKGNDPFPLFPGKPEGQIMSKGISMPDNGLWTYGQGGDEVQLYVCDGYGIVRYKTSFDHHFEDDPCNNIESLYGLASDNDYEYSGWFPLDFSEDDSRYSTYIGTNGGSTLFRYDRKYQSVYDLGKHRFLKKAKEAGTSAPASGAAGSSVGKQSGSVASRQSGSSGRNAQAAPFRSAMDVAAYLRGKVFTDLSNGYRMTFTSHMEMAVNGTEVTGAMEVVNFSSKLATLRGVSPYDGGTVRIRVDASKGTITNIDLPSEVYSLTKTGAYY